MTRCPINPSAKNRPELIRARRALKAGVFADQVRKAVSTAPELTASQIAEIREILCPHQEGIA